MAERNPNQLFDNYAKEFSLRIELLRAIGEFEKAQAEAGLTRAKTLDELEQTRTTRMINDSLRLSLARIERAEREAEQQQKIAEHQVKELNYVAGGIRPQFLSTFDQRVRALHWLFAIAEANSEMLFEELPKACRSKDNWICLSQISPAVQEVPASVANVTMLVEWMRQNLHWYVAGSAVHRLMSNVVVSLTDAKNKAVADLQAKLDAVRKGQHGKMAELKAFLHID